MSRTYPRLGVIEFGKHLIESGDLDPIYIALDKLQLDPVTLNRWLLSYWCLYHAGTSSYLADAPTAGEFWERLRLAAENTEAAPVGGRWPRGHERRHWRGANAIKSYTALLARYRDRPEDMATYCATGDLPGQTTIATQTSFQAVSKRAQEHVAFGPWIAFKVADMLERVSGVAVSFDAAEVFMFDSPREAAESVWESFADEATTYKRKLAEQGIPWGQSDSDHAVCWSVAFLNQAFKGMLAPPRGFWSKAVARPIGLQEVETVLCKWKSHNNGHYPLNNDIREIRAGLAPWAERGGLARRFLDAMPKEVA